MSEERDQGSLRRELVSVEQRVRGVNQDLVAAKKSLAKDLASLEYYNREIRERLLSGGLTVSKATPDDKTKEQTSPSPQLAEVPREDRAQPLTFWVSFKDDTSEKNIEDWMQAIHGRRGKANDGWQNVEGNLPRPQSADGFLESLKKAQIVKAVTVNLHTGASQ